MIALISGDPNDPALPILLEGFRRSVTPGLVTLADLPGPVTAFLSPREDQAPLVATAAAGGKVLVFGSIGPDVAEICGLAEPGPLPDEWVGAGACAPAPVYGISESAAAVRWSAAGLATASPYRRRPFLRFDYADEWNNMGYGRITADGGPWSLACAARTVSATVLAEAVAPELAPVPLATLLDQPTGAILWWNRPVGPVDSAEWAVIEAFLADWRAGELPSVPVLEELPLGVDAAFTMRLDCDEDIASAAPLFELYRARGIPFSVAVKTGQEGRAEDLALLAAIRDAGGAILSHSVTHAPRWGGSEHACAAEARGSADWLEQRVPGLRVRYAVSPFHQNPGYVPAGLKRAGLAGFVGGIVANDPEMLLARGGTLPGDDTGIVSHSQQCMLHGDCMVAEGDPLAVPKAALRAALHTRSLFGFLDHPFSPRYDYGWGSEEIRLAAHAAFLDFLAAETSGQRVQWFNEDQSLDWIAAKSRLRLTFHGEGYRLEGDPNGFGVRWRGRTMPLAELGHA